MIYKIENILNEFELKFLKNLCENFKISNRPTNSNFYVRMKITESDFLKGIEEKFNSYIEPIKNQKYTLIQNGSCWINRVDIDTNTNDGFHHDITDISLVIYINDDFDGGRLEYIEGSERKAIEVKQNLGIVLDDKIPHRVTPVTEGVRYSLVCFFVEGNSKTKKTLL